MERIAREALFGPDPVFNFSSTVDLHNADMDIAQIDQSGLTMPDRDYYLKDDEPTVKIRNGYRDHLAEMFALIGEAREKAERDATTVLRIETELAKAADRGPGALLSPGSLLCRFRRAALHRAQRRQS